MLVYARNVTTADAVDHPLRGTRGPSAGWWP